MIKYFTGKQIFIMKRRKRVEIVLLQATGTWPRLTGSYYESWKDSFE